MSQDCPIGCIVCGTVLPQAMGDMSGTVQPSEGTVFRTYGHYGSTFWDSFEGEELVLVVCDECLDRNKARLMRDKRWTPVLVYDPTGTATGPLYEGRHVQVGRYFIDREPVAYFDGPEDITPPMRIEPEQIGTPLDATASRPSRIEWRTDWRSIKDMLLAHYAAEEAD